MGNRLHLYIQLVGVDIPYQKQGFGGLLLANAVKRFIFTLMISIHNRDIFNNFIILKEIIK